MTNVTPNFDISGLSSTVQDYLSLIYVMERDQEPVIGSRLAELLGVTPPPSPTRSSEWYGMG